MQVLCLYASLFQCVPDTIVHGSLVSFHGKHWHYTTKGCMHISLQSTSELQATNKKQPHAQVSAVTCETRTSLRTRPEVLTTATPVSSQLVSIPSTSSSDPPAQATVCTSCNAHMTGTPAICSTWEAKLQVPAKAEETPVRWRARL